MTPPVKPLTEPLAPAAAASANGQSVSLSAVITWVVATFGSLSVLLYFAGISIVMLRLIFYQLPFEAALADLSQGYFTAVAVTQIVLPAMAVAIIYLGIRKLLLADPIKPRLPITYAPATPRHHWTLVAAMALTAWILVLADFALARHGDLSIFPQFWVVGAIASITVVLLCYGLSLSLPNRTHHLSVATITALVVVASLPFVVGYNSTQPLQSLNVCPAVDGRQSWWMIGQDTGHFLAGDPSSGNHDIVWISIDNAHHYAVGSRTAQLSC